MAAGLMREDRMPDQPELQQDEDAYWRSCKEFVRLIIAELNCSLKANRVSLKKRRQICTTFTFSLCNFLDHQWMKPSGRTQYPLLCFAKTYFDIDVPLELSQINFPHKSVELHAMVGDEINWFFNEIGEDGAAIATGDVGSETADVEIDEAVELLPQPCPTCTGTGQCFCIRKGGGDSTNCARCGGSGHCKHCAGSGEWRHP
ncbi:MAG: hypothetical protein DWQ34_27145 [Planctomycetota bacterium]|nr:MAG: hypothetical protein DWQ34_27145 [Planctomycetota bacterium]REK20390.1 MAG: hypothetical protein DWQ41_25745 [Planctomycetota bacterium]REK26887.1 MAG: hypothetical protein DWQ45_27045 [Planctomycetota bacterium]